MDKIKVLASMEKLRNELLIYRGATIHETNPVKQSEKIKAAMDILGYSDIQKIIDSLKEEIEMDSLTITKGSRAKQRAV